MAAKIETHITISASSECSIGCGASSRCTAWITRNTAEAAMKAPCARPGQRLGLAMAEAMLGIGGGERFVDRQHVEGWR